MPLKTPSPEALAALREEIDFLDEEMHRLLIKRSAIIDRLIAVKGTAVSGSAFRPAREASMMHHIVSRHSGHLPLSTVEHIWRTIIATFTHIQSPYAVHVDISTNSVGMHDLARYQSGFDVPLFQHDSPEAVIAAVQASKGDLGIIALHPSSPTRWWDTLGHDNQPEIMARLPFIHHDRTPIELPAFVIANPLGDAAVHETTVIAVDRQTPLSASELNALDIISQTQNDDHWSALVVHEGDHIPDGARRVGSYAHPIHAHGH